MAHVGQFGSFLRLKWRSRGIGDALFRQSLSFAASVAPCAAKSKSAPPPSIEDDELIMEYLL
jgi:hypothetical protein